LRRSLFEKYAIALFLERISNGSGSYLS